VTDVKTEGNHLETLSDRELLLHVARRLDELHAAMQELAPHARALIEARRKAGALLGRRNRGT
jgi:hypothetical protein